MYAVRSDNKSRVDRIAVCESEVHVLIGLADMDTPFGQVDCIRLYVLDGFDKHIVQIAAVKQDMRRTITLVGRRPEVVPFPGLSGAPMANFLPQRANLNLSKRFFKTKGNKNARSICADLDSRSHLSEPRGLFIHLHIEAPFEQRQRGGQAADAATYHRD
jgi:hypothetical protein